MRDEIKCRFDTKVRCSHAIWIERSVYTFNAVQVVLLRFIGMKLKRTVFSWFTFDIEINSFDNISVTVRIGLQDLYKNR